MVAGQREADRVDELHAAVAANGLHLDAADAEDRDLRRIQKRRKGLDSEAAQVADGEGGAGEVVRGDAPSTAFAARSFMRSASSSTQRSWASRTTGTRRPRGVSAANPR